MTPLIETLRGLWMGTPIGDRAGWAIAWCGAILVVSVVAGRWLFSHRTAA